MSQPSPPLFLQSPGKEPCQTSQTSLEGDHSVDTPSPTSASPPTPIPRPKQDATADTPATERPGSIMVAPVPVPRQNLASKESEEPADKLAEDSALESDKSESKASSKTSSSDSGIEDGKSTPTSEEEKVPFEILLCLPVLPHCVLFSLIMPTTFSGCCGDSRGGTATTPHPAGGIGGTRRHHHRLKRPGCAQSPGDGRKEPPACG